MIHVCPQCDGTGLDGHDCGEDTCCCRDPYDEEDFAFDEDDDDEYLRGKCETCGGEYVNGWSCCTCDVPGDYQDNSGELVPTWSDSIAYWWHRMIAWRWPVCAHCGKRFWWPWRRQWCCSEECHDKWIPF